MKTDTARAPAYQRLADELRGQIVDGLLAPGDRLPIEPDLCALYGVSRSTVREALRVLSSQDLVSTTRGVTGGTFVVNPGVDHISDYLQASLGLLATNGKASVDHLLEIRELLEVPAAGLAALRRSEDQMEQMRSTLFDPRTVDPASVFESNRSFHVQLLRITGNPLLESLTRPVFGVLNQRFLRENAPKRFWHRVDRDHREILAMIEAEDQDGAEQAQHEHLSHLRTTYQRIDKEMRRSR